MHVQRPVRAFLHGDVLAKPAVLQPIPTGNSLLGANEAVTQRIFLKHHNMIWNQQTAGYWPSFMWSRDTALKSLKRTVGYSWTVSLSYQRSHGKTVTRWSRSLLPPKPRAHYPSPGTAAGSNLPTPDSRKMQNNTLNMVSKKRKCINVKIVKSWKLAIWSVRTNTAVLVFRIPASSNTRRISVARPVAETHLANCN